MQGDSHGAVTQDANELQNYEGVVHHTAAVKGLPQSEGARDASGTGHSGTGSVTGRCQRGHIWNVQVGTVQEV